jgi:hypothetical protein
LFVLVIIHMYSVGLKRIKFIISQNTWQSHPIHSNTHVISITEQSLSWFSPVFRRVLGKTVRFSGGFLARQADERRRCKRTPWKPMFICSVIELSSLRLPVTSSQQPSGQRLVLASVQRRRHGQSTLTVSTRPKKTNKQNDILHRSIHL